MSALRRETRELNAELEEIDSHMVRTQAAMDKAAAREARLRQQLQAARDDAARERKDAELLARQLQESDVASAQAARDEAQEARRAAQRVEAELEAARAAHSLALGSLRRQLRTAETAVEDARAESAAALAAAQRREDELTTERSELTAALAQAQHALDERAMALEGASTDAGSAEEEAHLRREAAAAAEAAVLAERRHNTQLRREVKALAAQAAAAKADVAAAKREAAQANAAREREVAALRAELSAAKAAAGSERVAQLEARLHTLAESVVDKQGRLDQARSERAALAQQLERERQARVAAENEAAGVFGGDLEAGGGGGGASGGASDASGGGIATGGGTDGGSFEVRRRPSMHLRSQRGGRSGSALAISRLRPIARHRQVAKAVDVVDRFTLQTGWQLSRNPMARLLFLCYLLLLHLWAFFILAFHTHSLDHAHPEEGLFPAGPGQPGGPGSGALGASEGGMGGMGGIGGGPGGVIAMPGMDAVGVPLGPGSTDT